MHAIDQLNSLLSQRRFIDAIAVIDTLRVPAAEVPRFRCLKGQLLAATQQTDEAIRYLSAAAVDDEAAIFGLADLLQQRGMVDEAVALGFRNPTTLEANRWSAILQWVLKSPTATPGDLLARHSAWADLHCYSKTKDSRTTFNNPLPKRLTEGPVSVGYHCSFWNTPTMRNQMLPHIYKHDRSAFRPVCLTHHPIPPDIASAFSQVIVTGGLSDAEFVDAVRGENITILVECTGFSPGHRFAAMSQRAAPIQVSYLNHTGPSGVREVDYILADKIALPPEEEPFFNETVYRLNRCFFSFDFTQSPHPDPAACPFQTRGFITFGFFGGHSKVNATLLGWWAEIMRQVPSAKFLIRNNELLSPDNRTFLSRQFANLGIDPNRVDIRPGVSRDETVAGYKEIDISLDSWPYCGGNTIAESMWQGVPVVTYRGKRFSAAYGASLVAGSGLPECVAHSPDEYISIAVRLATKSEQLLEWRFRLREIITESGFNSSKQFCRSLEDAYRDMLNCTELTDK
jgi:hypothetical protein